MKKCNKQYSAVVVITTAQVRSTKPEIRFCAGSSPACGMLEIRDGEDLSLMSWLEISFSDFFQNYTSL